MTPNVILLQQNQSLIMGASDHIGQEDLKAVVVIVSYNIQTSIMAHTKMTIQGIVSMVTETATLSTYTVLHVSALIGIFIYIRFWVFKI